MTSTAVQRVQLNLRASADCGSDDFSRRQLLNHYPYCHGFNEVGIVVFSEVYIPLRQYKPFQQFCCLGRHRGTAVSSQQHEQSSKCN